MKRSPEILLIEDGKDDRELFDLAVKASGLEATVTHAVNAAEAVARLNRVGAYAGLPLPALIVLDLGLPGLNGKVLLQVIRNAYSPRSVPVVVLTGSVNAADRTECHSWGISDYLIKPTAFGKMVHLTSSLARSLAAAPADETTPRSPSQTLPDTGEGGRPAR